MKLRYLLPLLLFSVLVLCFWRGLQLDPKQLPSTLINQPVPRFRLVDVKQPQLYLTQQDLQGHFSLLNVWASWCLSCREEHAQLMAIAKDKHIALYGLNFQDKLANARAWLNTYGNPYLKTGWDPQGQVGIDWGVYGTPETYLIDPQGIIRYKLIGPLTAQAWQQKLLPILRQLQQEAKTP